MSLTVNTNVASMNAQRNLSKSSSALNTSLQRLSSGLRINSAKDDAAGLAITQGMTSQIRGNQQAVKNANDGISLAQTAEGALGQVSDNMQRIREIAVQASNGSISDVNRSQLQKEVDQLTQEISRIVATTDFNGTTLLSGGKDIAFQVGSEGATNNQVTISGSSLEMSGLSSVSTDLTATTTIDVSTSAAASGAIETLDTDIDTVTNARATFGAVQNRFEAVIANLQNYVENLDSARSRIQDADFASETAALTKNQILQQAGTSILSQANKLPQQALTLLQ